MFIQKQISRIEHIILTWIPPFLKSCRTSLKSLPLWVNVLNSDNCLHCLQHISVSFLSSFSWKTKDISYILAPDRYYGSRCELKILFYRWRASWNYFYICFIVIWNKVIPKQKGQLWCYGNASPRKRLTTEMPQNNGLTKLF